MFRKDEDHRKKVPVTVGKVKYLVDVTLQTMHRVDTYGNKNFTDLRVCRKDTGGEMDDGEVICESRENDVQQDDRLSISDAHGAPMQNSDFNPFSSYPRLSHAAPAPIKTIPRNGMPDGISAKEPIKTKDETIQKVEVKTGLVCWVWMDPADEQPSWSNFLTGDGEKLERMYQTNSHEAVDVTVREERHLVSVPCKVMYRAEPNDNNTTFLHVDRWEPYDEMDGREPICVPGDSDGQFATSSSVESPETQSSGVSGTSTRSSSHPADGGDGGQNNLYWCLGMAQQSKDEHSVFVFEALDEDILKQITKALEEERWGDDRSPVPLIPIRMRSTHPLPRPTDVGAIGLRRPGLVKLKKMVESQIGLSMGNKKDPMEADPQSIGEKKASTEKAEQTMEIPRHKETSPWRERTSPVHRGSMPSLEEPPGDVVPMASMKTKKQPKRPGVVKKPQSSSTNRKLQNKPRKAKPLTTFAANEKRPPTKKRKEERESIRSLIEEVGSQHVFIRKAGRINNPGNIRFHSIVDKYCLEYEGANYSLKGKIMKRIVAEVKSNGSNFLSSWKRRGMPP
jgi:hypothetical protein